METITALAAAMQDASSIEALLDLSASHCRGQGMQLMSYYHLPPCGAPDHVAAQTVRATGFPDTWDEEYHARGYRYLDPVLAAARTAGRPFLWSEVGSIIRLTPEQRTYVEAARAAGLGEGLAIPVHGPCGRDGYVGVGPGSDDYAFGAVETVSFHHAAQLFHLRYCQLVAEAAPTVRLSKREAEIVSWMAAGKSNQSIADILSIARGTVDTYVVRLFRKLEANDRVTASLRAASLGLI